MEENERFTLFGEHCIKDNSPDACCQLLNAYVACVILNEQDKENQQLKQQLHDLPKKIVGEIRTDFLYGIDGETTGIDIILDTILEKFGGKDESNND